VLLYLLTLIHITIIDHTTTMVVDICMVGTIVVGTITTTDTDIDLVTTITMGTVIIMDVVTVHNLDVMDITEIEVSITDIERIDQHNITEITTGTVPVIIQIHETTDIIIIIIEKILTIELHEIEVITVDLLRAVVIQEQVDLRQEEDKYEITPQTGVVYVAIISNTLPTINPPNVPTIYPIIAISTPMGISALE